MDKPVDISYRTVLYNSNGETRECLMKVKDTKWRNVIDENSSRINFSLDEENEQRRRYLCLLLSSHYTGKSTRVWIEGEQDVQKFLKSEGLNPRDSQGLVGRNIAIYIGKLEMEATK